MNPLVVAVMLAAATPAPGHHHEQGLHSGPQLGTVTFETSCSTEAQATFVRALGWLHSFEYEEAARTFQAAAAADPRCAIAHWGEAMTYYHPLWAAPSAAELAKGREALARAHALGAASGRERDYITALEAFYRDSDRLDHKTRVLAYADAMDALRARYPDDREAAVFDALALIAAGTMDADPAFTKEHQAGAILNRVLALEPDHPGVAHYLIHSFDYPPLAELALPAARRYAAIAPDSPHAQHMPSHIFVRLGLWDEAIQSNLASEASARAFAKAQGLPDSSSERLHAMDYLAYAYLQTGRDAEAARVLADLKSIRRADPPIFTVAYAATAIPARFVLERRRWKEAAALALPASVRSLAPLDNFGWATAHIHFARAIGAARSGDAPAARAELAKLGAIEDGLIVPPGTYDWQTQVSIARQVAEAWTTQAEGRGDEALRIMRAAAALDDASEKHPVTPGALLPAREQLGELLLALGRPADALREYEAALIRTPHRLGGLYGAARAARGAGETVKAADYYAELVKQTAGGDAKRPEIAEARAFAASLARK